MIARVPIGGFIGIDIEVALRIERFRPGSIELHADSGHTQPQHH